MSDNPFEIEKAKRVEFERCELTPVQRKAWAETKTLFLWSAPAFANVLYQMMLDPQGNEAFFTKDLPHPAATDDHYMFINPDSFFKFSLEERVFVVAHEIMHCILNHCGQLHMHKKRGTVKYQDGSSLKFDFKQMASAMDLVINDILIEGRVGKFPEGGLHDTSVATAKDAVVDVYKRIYVEDKDGGGGKGQGQGKGDGKSFDEHLEPGKGDGKSPSEAQQERNGNEWKAAVAAAANAARVQGKLPGSLDRFFKELLEPKVDWAEKLRTLFARKIGNSCTSWQTLDQQLVVRGIGAPGRMGHGAGTIVVGCDTSGSISQKMLDMFMAEIAGILEDVRPRRLVMMQCDARVQEVLELDDSAELKGIKLKGGGGTDFVPVFDKIAEEFGEIDGLVYLTDGFGRFPDKAPGYTVIWGNITEPKYKPAYPFGDIVDVPVT